MRCSNNERLRCDVSLAEAVPLCARKTCKVFCSSAYPRPAPTLRRVCPLIARKGGSPGLRCAAQGAAVCLQRVRWQSICSPVACWAPQSCSRSTTSSGVAAKRRNWEIVRQLLRLAAASEHALAPADSRLSGACVGIYGPQGMIGWVERRAAPQVSCAGTQLAPLERVKPPPASDLNANRWKYPGVAGLGRLWKRLLSR